MGRSRGKMTRPLVKKAIELGHLDHWISAKDVAWIINCEYQVRDPSERWTSYGRRNKWVTTMSAAVILSEFARKGLLEIKRKGSEVSLYRKVDKVHEQEDMEATQ